MTERREGGCHCGRVRFVVSIEARKALECNCSICSKKGFLHVIVPRGAFELVKGRESLRTYTFNTHVAQHQFCEVCGVSPFYVPRSHPEGVSANLRCFDDGPTGFEIEPFDGQNWEDTVHTIR